MTIDVIINTYNKEKNILNIYNKLEEELKNINHKYIFVDDNSNDKTIDILKEIQKNNESNVKIIEFSKKFGKDACIYAGLLHTKHELVCIYDTSLQANTTHITKMIDYLISHPEYDQICMYSNGIIDDFKEKTKVKLLNTLHNIEIDKNKTYYRVLRKNVVNALIENTKYYPFSIYSFEIIGFNTYYLKFDNKKSYKTCYSKMVSYSRNKKILYKSFGLIILVIAFMLLLFSIFDLISISNNILLFLLLLISGINFLLISFCFNTTSNKKTTFIIKNKIGFDDNVL